MEVELNMKVDIMSERLTGKVKWFNNKKGYGFIERDSTEEDIFVHYRQILSDGFRTLREGQAVEFVLNQGPKGLQAHDVQILEESTLN